VADGIPYNSHPTLVVCIPMDCCRGAGESQLSAPTRNTIMGLPCEGPWFLGLLFVFWGGGVFFCVLGLFFFLF